MSSDPYEITSAAELRTLFGEPSERVRVKELPALDERSAAFVAAAPFLLLATSGADGSCDVSPKGGPPGFVRVLGERRLLIPEFPGNKRFDGVQNLVARPGLATLFVVPGITETLRVNGHARLTREPALLEVAAVGDRQPWFVLDVEVAQVFSHCAKAFLRGGLWQPQSWPDPGGVPTPSRTIAERAAEQRVAESEARRALEQEYEPGLY